MTKTEYGTIDDVKNLYKNYNMGESIFKCDMVHVRGKFP